MNATPPPAHRTPGLPDDSTPDAFAARLKELFTAAGNPTLASTANAVGGKVTVGALSHWRTGRHLPAQFSTIEPVLAWLTDRAYRQPTATAADAHAAQIWPIRAWAAYFERVTTTDPHRRSVLNALAAADMLGTSGELDEAALASLAAQLTATDIHEAAFATSIDRPEQPQLATTFDQLAAAGIITAKPTNHQQWGWAYPELLTEWTPLVDWIATHRTALATRSALLDDAARWEKAGRPANQLYRHQRLTTTSEALTELAPTPTQRVNARANDVTHWFGPATAEQIPEAAANFWHHSQLRARTTLRTHKAILATVFAMIALAIIISAVAGAMINLEP